VTVSAAERVARAGEDAVRRVSRRPAGWWQTRTARGRTRAEAVAALVETIANTAHDVEGTHAHGTPPPPPREDVLADQLAVVTYDLTLVATDEAADDAVRAYDATMAEVD
jgi:hypothetical protein